jgi:MFS family permease
VPLFSQPGERLLNKKGNKMQLNLSLRNLGRPFLILWGGTTISLFGKMLASFALNVWVFQKSGSVLIFSGMVAATTVPALLILPWSGCFADRVDRRYVLVISSCFTVILAFALAAQLWIDRLAIWHLYAFNIFAAAISAFESPAYQATVSSLLSKKQLTRGVGLIGFSRNLFATLAPMAAGGLLGYIGLQGIIIMYISLACIAIALVIKAVTCMPVVEALTEPKAYFSVRSVLRNFVESISYFQKQRLLMGLLAYVIILNSLLALVSTLFIPLVLSNYTARELGLIMAIGGLGSMLGSGILFVSDALKHLMKIILACDAILSTCILLSGSSNSLVLYLSCAFIAMFAGAVGGGCSTSLWMRKIPLERQGSIFALVGTIALVMVLIVTVAGGFIADHVFEPALSSRGILVDCVNFWLSIGKGSGLNLVFVLCGFLGVLSSLGAFMHSRFRNMDSFVPDGR